MPSQPDLFTANATASAPVRVINLADGELIYLPGWLSSIHDPKLPDDIFQTLKSQVDWQQSQIRLYGKTVAIPRLNAWYGESGCGYTYSGTYFEPLPWLDVLQTIKQQVEKALKPYLGGSTFNSSLINLYRHGQDSVAWHSDDEPELGVDPLVASLSLGETRVFQLKHNTQKQRAKVELLLAHGDLLLMRGATQHHWQHQIPKTRKTLGERINITLRKVI